MTGHVWNPDFEDETEREQSERLAESRQQIAHEALLPRPTWDELTEHERTISMLEARNYLRALTRAGYTIMHPVDESEDDGW